MQIDKIRQTLRKIQALTDNLEENGTTSALERDLLLRYLRDMYEMVTSAEATAPPMPEVKKSTPVIEEKPVPVAEKETKMPASTPQQPATGTSENHEDGVKKAEVTEKEDVPVMRQFSDPTRYFPPEEENTAPKAEPTPAAKPRQETSDIAVAENENRFEEIFTPKRASDIVGQLQSQPLTRIEEGLGLNERLMFINSLFGGDPNKFNETLRALNAMSTYSEARKYLASDAAVQYEWDAESRLDKARNFAQLVIRKYQNG